VGGDAVDLVMKLNALAFPEAAKIAADLSGIVTLPGNSPRSTPTPFRGPARPAAKRASPPPEKPSGLPLAEASTLVTEATACLWGPRGETALAYLHGRGLTDETSKTAGLGFTPGVSIPTAAGDRCYWFCGITIPWRDGERLTKVKIRRIDDGKPKYSEAYADRPRIYPDPAVIRVGEPLVITEGEFDCLLLAQQLPEASVVTLGSASARTDPDVLSRMLSAPTWFVALHADQAGDRAAAKFPAWATRVRPPVEPPLKDWGDLHAQGWNCIRYHWGRYLPMSKNWVELEPKGELV